MAKHFEKRIWLVIGLFARETDYVAMVMQTCIAIPYVPEKVQNGVSISAVSSRFFVPQNKPALSNKPMMTTAAV
jgi:hypothetical protein